MAKEISSLTEFIEWAEQFNDGQYLFRGVSNEKYEIEASAYRRLDKKDRIPANLLKINKRLIEDARLQGHGQKDGDQFSDLELLAELQHYGAATCLIDFTYSAQVALWMACHPGSKGPANGKVFAVNISDPNRFQKVKSLSLKKDIDCFFQLDERGRYSLYQWQPKPQNNRIIAQQSIFLFGGDEIKEEVECLILKDSKRDIRLSLEKAAGITEAMLFPDFGGFVSVRAQNKPYIELDALGYLQRGIEAHKESKLDEAIKHYTHVIDWQPDDSILVRAYNRRGNAYEGKGKQDLAFEDYSMAIKINPDDADAYFYRGFTYELKGNFGEAMAIKDYDKAIELKPDHVDAYIYRAGVSNRDPKLAIKDYSKAIELNPKFAYAYRNRGLTYEKRGEVDLAIKDYNKAIDLNSVSALDYSYRARAYKKKGVTALAIEDYKMAITLNPYYDKNYYDLIMIRLQQQDWKNAKADLIDAQNRELNIISLFSQYHRTIADLEEEIGVELPEDIAAMLRGE